MWRSSDGLKQVTLPFDAIAISSEWIQFYEFAKAYTIGYTAPRGTPTQWPKGAKHHVFLLAPDGEVTDIQIGGGPWSELRIAAFALTKVGIVVYGGALGGYLKPGTAGIYLATSKRQSENSEWPSSRYRCFAKWLQVAVAMQTYAKTPDPTRIRIVELCGGRANGKR